MRTTLSLDEDNADRLQEIAQRTKRPFKRVVNETIRRGLEAGEVYEAEAPYKVISRPMHLRAGIDPARLAKIEADLDLERFENKLTRPKKEKR